jgi:hypothetical protein
MPYPGSQTNDTIAYAYYINKYIFFIRLLGLALAIAFIISAVKRRSTIDKFLVGTLVVIYGTVFYYFNFKLEADKIFYLPTTNASIPASQYGDKSKLVIGVVLNGEAKAYPIQQIGYHHQVRDSVGGTSIMITYCTVCRTGRVFSPVVNGKASNFRLVGMDHFNAVFEDEATESWWQQATGTAVMGPLKGTTLKEYPSRQMTLEAWMRQYPSSLVMKPDPNFVDNYFRLEDYDKGEMRSELVKRNLSSWQPKSWIIGVKGIEDSKAYDWNEVLNKQLVEDSLPELPLLIMIESDASSFHAYNRTVNGSVLHFVKEGNDESFYDTKTYSRWNVDGLCVEGALKNERLLPVQAYNEFYHSWRTFQANTDRIAAD